MRGTVPWLGQNASLVGDKGAVVAVGIGVLVGLPVGVG